MGGPMDVRKTQAQIVGTTTYGTGREESIASGQATATSGGGRFCRIHFFVLCAGLPKERNEPVGGGMMRPAGLAGL